MKMTEKKAVVLLSGGLDSTTCMSVAHQQGFALYALTFDYGQRHRRELESAGEIAGFYNAAEHRVIKLDSVGGSALTDASIELPDFQETEGIPVTYVPARNILFLSYALGYGEVVEADVIVIGVNAIDYSGYPDCRPEFIQAFQKVIEVGTRSGVQGNPIEILTPLIHLTKGEIVRLAVKNGAPLHLTNSCYRGEEKACGRCDSCRLRLRGFAQAGVEDPIQYYKRD